VMSNNFIGDILIRMTIVIILIILIVVMTA
jgi:hypothetical protein